MTNLSPEFCRKLKDARREAGLSQSVVANEVGCKQSALSMFEQGDGTKLNDDTVTKLCAKFGIELPKEENNEAVSAAAVPRPLAAAATGPHTAFCPNPACPSHFEYFVDGRRFLRPDREKQDPVGGKFCAICGEVLEHSCPNCGAPVHEGGVCSYCGSPYVAVL